MAIDPDLNKYDSRHAVTSHPNMTKSEWSRLYWDAWKIYYTENHVETILRRARASRIDIFRLMLIVLWFLTSLAVEKVHPLQGGILRLKNRLDRRPGLSAEPAWRFYPPTARPWNSSASTRVLPGMCGGSTASVGVSPVTRTV